MANASLTLVGSGIKFLSHLTIEAKSNIEQADHVLYLVNDPAMKKWIKISNTCSTSLDMLYQKYYLRSDCYQAITDYILENLFKNQHICVVFYGHPCVFAQSGLDAVVEARKQGYEAKILPGISAEACLFADLLIDPGTVGCQSFEATDFLIHKRKFDTSAHLILWQVDIIGVLNNPISHDNSHGIRYLIHFLNQYYPLNHTVIVYEAAQYPSFEAKIQRIDLEELSNASLSPISLLYIPPVTIATHDKKIIQELKMNFTDIKTVKY